MKIIVALGGNAVIRKGEKENYRTLIKNIKEMVKNIAPIIKRNQVVITHGNGIEIGLLALQNEIAKNKIPPMPLDILGAESQALIGYPLEEQIINALRDHKKDVTTILTQVLVSKDDPAFKNPTKFIGPFYTKAQAQKLKNKYKIKKDSNRGYRRVVPSPIPIEIIERKTIKRLLRNTIVIAVGGGGIPVIQTPQGLKGIEAVIDKDLASAALANSIKASVLMMLTSVPNVYLNYGTKKQIPLKTISLDKIKALQLQGHFPPGSMGPKIQAAINFLEKRGKKVIITNPENAIKALNNKKGTIITKE